MEREVSEVDRKLLLKKNYLDKIRYYLNRNPIDQEELYTFIRKFFSEYLKLDYEFTYEELSQELNKVFIKPVVKEHIDAFLIRLSESEYLEEMALGTVEINAYLKELDDIIRNVIFDDQPVIEESPTLIQKVLKIKHTEQEKAMDASSVAAIIDEINFHITNGNIDTAKTSYVELSKVYDKLNKDDKKKLHDDMNEVYERLQTLIKNPKSVATANKQNVSEFVRKVIDFAEETVFYINASNVDAAKKSYSATLQAYESLSPEEKKSMHSRVSDLYTQLQVLSSRSKTDAGKISTTKGLIGNENVIDADLPEMEPVSENVANNELMFGASTTSTASAVPTNSLTSPPSNAVTTSATNISTASFVEEFGKTVASSPLFTDGITANSSTTSNSVTDATNANVISSNVASNTSSFDFSSPIDTDLASTSPKKTYSAFQESLTEEINSNTLTKNSTDNVLFTASSSDEIKPVVAKSSVKSSTLEKKGSDKKTVIQPTIVPSLAKPSVSPIISPVINTIKPMVSPAVLGVKTDVKIASKPETIKSELTIKPELNKLEIKVPSASSMSATSAPILASTVASTSTSPAVPLPLDKLNILLKKIDDDIVMDKLDKAKNSYKEALLIYRSLRDSDKTKCYVHFFDTFKKLDDTLHQKALHTILDEHLSESANSHRPMTSTHSFVSETEKYIPESDSVIKGTTLPIILSNDPETTRVYELIEESYFNIDNSNADLAMLKYFKALEFYHKLPIADKKRAYADLYNLFRKLSVVKKVRL